MRASAERRFSSLAWSWASCDKPPQGQPPQMPMKGQGGWTRSGEGSSTSSTTARENEGPSSQMRASTVSPMRPPATKTALPSGVRASPSGPYVMVSMVSLMAWPF